MKLKTLIYFAVYFVITFIISFFYIFQFFRLLYDFQCITARTCLISSASLGFVLSIGILIYKIIQYKKKRLTKISNWVLMNSAKLCLLYIISVICMVSIKSSVVFTIEELRNFISLIWMIFGISITVFLVWNVIIINYLKAKKPIEKSTCSQFDRLQFLVDKRNFVGKANIVFNSLYLLIISLVVLSLATVMTYISSNNINLINQNFCIIAFYFCLNALGSTFIDILKPLVEEKNELLMNSKISTSEFEELNYIYNSIIDLINKIKEIETSSMLNSQEKKAEINKVLSDYAFLDEKNINAMMKNQGGKTNDQL